MHEKAGNDLTEETCLKVRMSYGEECFQGNSGSANTINQQFFAGLFKELYEPIYEETENAFFVYNSSNGLWEKTSESTIMNMVGIIMREFSAWKEVQVVNQKRNAGAVRDIIRFLQGICKESNAFEKKAHSIIHCGNGVLCFNNEREEW